MAAQSTGAAVRSDSQVESLSLGNQQRVQLAVALVHRQSLLLLDELFSGLDPIGVDVLAGVRRRPADDGTPIAGGRLHRIWLAGAAHHVVGRDGSRVCAQEVDDRGAGDVA